MPTVQECEPTAEAEEAPKGRGKKRFIAPAVTVPVDVLKATTYFQAVESGATG